MNIAWQDSRVLYRILYCIYPFL